MEIREERRKRLLFREVNERISRINADFAVHVGTMVVLCECGRGDCLDRVEVPSAVFAESRTERSRFLVSRDHPPLDAARVVAEGATYAIYAAA